MKSRKQFPTFDDFFKTPLPVVAKRKGYEGSPLPLMEDGEQIGKKKQKRPKKRSKKQMPELPDRMELQIEDGLPTSPSLMENNGDNPNALDLLEQPQDEQDELDGQHQEVQVLTPPQQQHNIGDDPLASTSPHHHREDDSTSPQHHEEDGLQLPLSARYHRNDGPQVPTTFPQQHGDDSPQTPTSPQYHGDDPHIPTCTQYHSDDDPQVPIYTRYHDRPYDNPPPQPYMSIDADPHQQLYRSHSSHAPPQPYMTLPCQGLQQMDPTPPKIPSVAAAQSSPPQKQSYASVLKSSKKLYEIDDLIYVTPPEGMFFESYMKGPYVCNKPLGRPGIVVDVGKSDGTLVVFYPVIRKNVLRHAADVTKVTHFKGDDVMVVNDIYLILEYHGESAIKFCDKRGTIIKVFIHSRNKKVFIVKIGDQEVKFNQVCLMPIPSDTICAVCYTNFNDIALNCSPKHQICSQCLLQLEICPFCREPIQ